MADLEGFEREATSSTRGSPSATASWSKRSTRSAASTTREIRRIVGHLRRRACRLRRSRSRRRCSALVTFYETGDDSDREAFDIAWVQNRDSAVDTMNGFIEVYMDARGMKGAWEGVVYYANHEKTDKIRALATHAQWFEDHLPSIRSTASPRSRACRRWRSRS